MRLRLARICRTGDVLAEHAAFRRQRPEFFDVVNRPNMQPFAVSDQNFLMLLIAVRLYRSRCSTIPSFTIW